MGNLNIIAIVMVIGLTIFTVGLAIFVRRFTRTTADFYLAGRKVGTIANASAISGDYLSAASFLGVAAAVYASGLDGVWFAAGFAGGFIVVVLFIASALRRFGEYTVADFAYGRFGSDRIRLVTVVMVLLTSLFYMAPQMYGAGTTWTVLVGAGLFGLSPYNTGVLIVSLIIMFYVMVGGMKGTTLNQIFQFWWLWTAMFLVVVFAFTAGSFRYPNALAEVTGENHRDVKTHTVAELTADDGALLAAAEGAMSEEAFAEVQTVVDAGDSEATAGVLVPAKNKLHTLRDMFFNEPGHRYNNFDQFSMVLALVLGTAGLPHILNRYYTNPSGAAARRSTFWVLVFIGTFYIMAPIAGLAGRQIIDNAWRAGAAPTNAAYVDGLLLKSDAIMPTLAQILGGEWLMGAVAAGAFAAMFSTTGGLLIASASAVGHDVYEKYINPGAPEIRKVFVGKASVLFFAFIALGIGLGIPAVGLDKAYPALIAMMVTWAFSLGAGAFVPMLLTGIWWRQTTERGAIAGMIVGGGGSIFFIFMNILKQLGHLGTEGLLPFLGSLTFPTLFTFPAAVLTIIIVSKLDGQLPKNVEEIWMRIHGTASERHEREMGLDKVGSMLSSGGK
ncbi:MAG: cation acetate symporter [Coriobacteriia bacterium]|nr:cation acetate symporter [Coriobacteriia bacterium]